MTAESALGSVTIFALFALAALAASLLAQRFSGPLCCRCSLVS